MKCPLIKKVEQIASATLEVGVADCLRFDCGMFDPLAEECSILIATKHLGNLMGILEEIRRTMPHWSDIK